jgi:hypothetical protein
LRLTVDEVVADGRFGGDLRLTGRPARRDALPAGAGSGAGSGSNHPVKES